MSLFAVGLNHNSAPLEVREAVAFPGDALTEQLDSLRKLDIEEGAIISTCNRTEIYSVAESGREDAIVDWLQQASRLDSAKLQPYLYTHADASMVRHSFRVAAGLDSMVIGEPQILGQMKQAVDSARGARTVGPLLSRLFDSAFSVAKQVRSETEIGAHPVSIAYAAVKLAQRIFTDLGNSTALLIGAGETIELVARHLQQQGMKRMIFANRNLDRAQRLAHQFHGYAIPLEQIGDHLAEADILVSSTAASEAIVSSADIRDARKGRQRRPMFILDLAVPRDIEPTASRIEDVYLYSIDDLRGVIESNLQSRSEAAKHAEIIVEERTASFMQWLESRHASGTIRMMRQQALAQRDRLLEEALRKLEGGADADEILREYGRRLTNRLLHMPSRTLRRAESEDQQELLRSTRRLFGLE